MNSQDKLIDFLCRAKRSTYAGKGAETEPSRPMSHDLVYEEEPFRYHDTYLGGEKFAGEEAVWCDGAACWAMNYCGRTLGRGFSSDFLKEALCLASTAMPYRGPREYRSGDFLYRCVVDGCIEWFNGVEEIYRNDRKVYECMFHGGLVK